MTQTILRSAALFWAAVLLLACFERPALAASGVTASRAGVTVYVADTAFSAQPGFLKKGSWQTLPADKLPYTAEGHPVLAAKTTVISMAPDGSSLAIYCHRGDSLVRRGEVALDAAGGAAKFKLLAGPDQGRLTVEVYRPAGSLRQAVSLSADGILEIRQPPGREVTVTSPLNYALVPSLIGTDLLFDPASHPSLREFWLPNMNMVVGLGGDSDSMMVGVWPPGEQSASLQIAQQGRPRQFKSFRLSTAGRSFYLAFIDHPDIWHEEPLKAEYLEKDTAIGWRRPFDARWIGRFYIESEQYDFPFYIAPKKFKLWGRYVRGWYNYPFWFDGPRTMVHFEKKFPPKGRLLIYYLETYQDHSGILSPIGVMQESLGRQEAARLLDFAGVDEQVLLVHRNAVCAMTRKIEGYFAAKEETKRRAEVGHWADDVATFIRLIRERVFQFDRLAADLEPMVTAQRWPNGDPQAMKDLVDEIHQRAKEDLPKTSLEEVRGWTEGIKALAVQVRPDNLTNVKKLTQHCRSVAGTQDDLNRALSVLAIRVMEAAADAGVKSPECARSAGQIIAQTRAVLRRPTWWEPCRKYLPKSDPGAP